MSVLNRGRWETAACRDGRRWEGPCVKNRALGGKEGQVEGDPCKFLTLRKEDGTTMCDCERISARKTLSAQQQVNVIIIIIIHTQKFNSEKPCQRRKWWWWYKRERDRSGSGATSALKQINVNRNI